jgi:hypothetical protein
MKHLIALVLVLLAAVAATAPARAEDVNLNFYPIAPRYLDKDFWDPVEDQYAFGGTVDFGKAGWPLHFAIGLHGSLGDENLDPLASGVTAVVNELSFGIAKVWTPKGTVRPFLSGGVSFVHAYKEFNDVFLFGDVDDNDDSVGVWVEGGVYWRLSPHFNLGMFGRFLEGSDITLFDVDGDADYWEWGPMIGWSWPAKK